MHFGYDIPTRGPLATPENISSIAQRGEALGFGTAYVNDHIVVPRDIASRYPYSEGGDWAGGQFGEAMDILSMLAFLAAATSKVRLLTSVMVVPYRHPVVTAKMIATIDVLSNGRVTIGCGAGWMEEEFIAVGTVLSERGKSTDEYLKIFREIWTKETPSYDGTYASFGNIAMLPQPKQSPLPIWMGGGRPALGERQSMAMVGIWWLQSEVSARYLGPVQKTTFFIARRSGEGRARPHRSPLPIIRLGIPAPAGRSTSKESVGCSPVVRMRLKRIWPRSLKLVLKRSCSASPARRCPRRKTP